MIKVLLKRQFSEILAFYFIDRKTGKRRTAGKTALYAVLFSFLFLYIAAMMFLFAMFLAESLFAASLDWMYFSLMGLMSITLGTFGSVFTAYSVIYNAKDNEFLISLPIPPKKILIARIISVFLLDSVFSALVYVPALIAYFVFGSPTFLSAVTSVLLIFVICAVSLVLSCLLGWVIGLINSRMKNKNIITAVISVAFLAVYMWACSNLYNGVTALLAHLDALERAVKGYIYPAYALGMAATGDLLFFAGCVIAAALLVYATVTVLSRTFLGIATRKTASATQKEKKAEKRRSVFSALTVKEFRHLYGSYTCLMNCCLGGVLLIIAAVFVIISRETFEGLLSALDSVSVPADTVFALVGAAVMLVSAMNDYAAVALSLEGKSFWLLRSLPIETSAVIRSKETVQAIVTMPGTVFFAVAAAVVFKMELLTALTLVLFAVTEVVFFAEFDMLIGIKHPKFDWTNETILVKQSAGATIAIFGGFGISVAVGILSFVLSKFIPAFAIYLIMTAVFFAVSVFLDKYGMKKAERVFVGD